jgi:hypothetical protein
LKHIVVDLESDGLFGGVIGAGAVLVSENGTRLGVFGGYVAGDHEALIPWVRENVARHWLPSENRPAWLALAPYATREAMMAAFVEWLRPKLPGATLWVDCGYPVESAGLASVARELTSDGQRFVMVHDIATAILLSGDDVNVLRCDYARAAPDLQLAHQHNPVWDAWVSAVCLGRSIGANRANDG